MKISNRDWVQLSAYLDGELSQRESSKLENRIEANPALAAALVDLKTVKEIVAVTPRLSVPRDFKLTPELVGAPRKEPRTRGYRLAAAALSFLFIGVVVLDLGTGSLKGGVPSALAPRAEEVMLEAASDVVEEPAMLMAEEAVEEEMPQEAAEIEAEAQESAAPAPEMEAPAEAGDSPGTLEEGEADEMAEPESKTVPGEENRAAGADADDWEEQTGAQDAPLPTQAPVIEEEHHYPEQEISRTIEAPGIPWMRILEIIFGLGAVGFAAAAWYTRRQAR